MNRARIWAIIIKFWFDVKRDTFRLFDVFWWPAFDLFIWGLLSTYLTKTSGGSVNFVLLFLAGMIFWSVFDRASRDISRSMMEEIWNRNLPNIFSTPLTLTEYVTGVLVVGTIKLIIGAVFLLILAAAYYGFQMSALGWFTVVAMVGLMLFGWSVSFIIQAIVLRYGHTVEVFIWAIGIFLQPFSAVFYPVSVLPQWAQLVARALPPMYLFEAMRAIIVGKPVLLEDIMLSFGLNVAYLVFSIIYFYRTFQHAKFHGLLTKQF